MTRISCDIVNGFGADALPKLLVLPRFLNFVRLGGTLGNSLTH